MAEPPSDDDRPGYVYAFEVQGVFNIYTSIYVVLTENVSADPSFTDPTKLRLKVGYTEDLSRRMDQWQKKCHSQVHVLRGHWPGGLVDEPQDTENGSDASVTEGPAGPGPKGPLCHLVERLVHLELADLVVNGQYLDPDFMLPKKSGIPTPPKIAPKGRNGKIRFPRDQCRDCECPFNICQCPLIDYVGGAVHREIFTLARVEEGRYKGKEWNDIVKPIIEKWGECPGREAYTIFLTAKIGAFVKGYIRDE